MADWYFVSDLHGKQRRCARLLAALADRPPRVLLVGGDLLPRGNRADEAGSPADFISGYLRRGLAQLRSALGPAYPRILVILGNDDPQTAEDDVLALVGEGLWEYIHARRVPVGDYDVYGYACVPPTPFLLKDWERYDVSRYVDPGCVPPEEGRRSLPVDPAATQPGTLADELAQLVGPADLAHAIMLFHSPPYDTALDRAALDGRVIDHAPVDVHVGSIAIRRLIEERQPLVTLHGHIHEAARLTGAWADQIGRTHMFTAAHDGPELALVTFDPADPAHAQRLLL